MQSRPAADMLVEVVEIPMPWWSQSHLNRLDLLRGRDQEVHPPSALPEKMSQASSPWTLPLPPPLPNLQECMAMDGEVRRPSPNWDLEHFDLEPAYVRLEAGPAVRASGRGKCPAPWLFESPSSVQVPNKPSPGVPGASVPSDPGLSGQRLKRVLHVKQAPIYKYGEWCAHWAEKGGRAPSDPMTPRSDLTKSEFDVQYGAWRKALVEGPPQGRGARILELDQHLREF